MEEDLSPSPLITAEQIFPAMEELVMDARTSLEMSLHIFSPRTKTRSKSAHQKKFVDWCDLLVDASRRGVKTEILLNDFDPIGLPEEHASVWERLNFLADAFAKSDIKMDQRPKLLVAHPGGQAGAMIRFMVWPMVRQLIKKALNSFDQTGRAIPPGLQTYHQNDVRWWPPARNHTQALHQKFIVADRERAIIGGMDIDERRYDDIFHHQVAEQTWHDVSAFVSGEDAKKLSEHFKSSWNMVCSHGSSEVAELPECHLLRDLNFVFPNKTKKEVASLSKIRSRSILRTVSAPKERFFGFGPEAKIREIETKSLEVISQARQYIYIETQFLRAKTIREALKDALLKTPELVVIVLLPAAPEEVAFGGQRGMLHEYGEWLQARALETLYKTAPDRFGAFCLTNERERNEAGERDALFEKSMVYIHSKVLIADDKFAIVGSANHNARSMEWDIEAAYFSSDERFCKELREELWRAHLSEASPKIHGSSSPKELMELWVTRAEEREALGASASHRGVVRFPLEETKRFSKRHLIIPRQMV